MAAEADSERQFFSLAEKAFREIERIERLFRKELQALNRKAGKTAFSCDKEVFEVMKRCYQYGVITEGAFDVTVTLLLEQRGIYQGERKKLPYHHHGSLYFYRRPPGACGKRICNRQGIGTFS